MGITVDELLRQCRQLRFRFLEPVTKGPCQQILPVRVIDQLNFEFMLACIGEIPRVASMGRGMVKILHS